LVFTVSAAPALLPLSLEVTCAYARVIKKGSQSGTKNLVIDEITAITSDKNMIFVRLFTIY
jgi:hypothetical protein